MKHASNDHGAPACGAKSGWVCLIGTEEVTCRRCKKTAAYKAQVEYERIIGRFSKQGVRPRELAKVNLDKIYSHSAPGRKGMT